MALDLENIWFKSGMYSDVEKKCVNLAWVQTYEKKVKIRHGFRQSEKVSIQAWIQT